MEDEVNYFDEYGFAVFKKECKFVNDLKINVNRKEALPDTVVNEWHKVLSNWKQYIKKGPSTKLLNLVQRGVPDELRSQLWQGILETDALKSSSTFNYEEHVDQLRDQLNRLDVSEFNTTRAECVLNRVTVNECQELGISEPEILNLKQIILDVGRTFPTHKQFIGNSSDAIEGRARLFRILAVYTRYNSAVGYCQGMSFIAGMLSIILPEVEAFWCFVVFLERPKYLYGYFDNKLEKIQRHATVFDQLLKQRQPDLWKHLDAYGIVPLMYVTPWFMCLFTSLPSWDVVLSIWDLVLLRGVVVIFEAAIGLMISMRDHLLEETDVNSIIIKLQNPSLHCVKRSVLLPTIFRVNVDIWEVKSISAVLYEKENPVHLTNLAAPQPSTNSKLLTKYFANIKQRFGRNKATNKENNLMKNLKKALSIGEHVPEKSILDDSFRFTSGSRSPLMSLQLSNSPSNDVWRLRRLKMVKKLSESPGVVNSLVGSSADQHWSFQQFSHQLPLRDNNVGSLSSFVLSPEKELKRLNNGNDSFSSQESSLLEKSSHAIVWNESYR